MRSNGLKIDNHNAEDDYLIDSYLNKAQKRFGVYFFNADGFTKITAENTRP